MALSPAQKLSPSCHPQGTALFILIALLSLFFAPSRPAIAQAPATGPAAPGVLDGLPIIKVEVVGNTRTSTQLILDQVRAQEGQPYSRGLIDVDVKAIAALDRFVTEHADVIPTMNPVTRQFTGVTVRFVVEERSIVTAVEIVGNRHVNDVQIHEGLLMRAGVAVDPFRIETDRKTILDLYLKKGYVDAAVTIDPKLLGEKGIVRYEIVEGPVSVIDHVAYAGNVALSDDYLNWRIQTKPHFWIFRKGLLEPEKLPADVVTIRDLYLKKGYLDARVSYTLDYSQDKSDLTVRFVIIEGPRYTVGKINIAGNKTFETFELLGDTHNFGPGSPAEQDKIDALQKRIEDAYGHQGYIYRNVEVRKAYTDQPAVVDININITEGLPFIVGRVIVRGNSDIKDNVIRREVRIYPDQTFDMVLVRKSIDRLKATRLLQDVKMTPITPPGNPPGVQDLLVETSEGQTGALTFGAGISTNSGLVGNISLEQRNFDINNPPRSWDEFTSGQSWKGAGQYFRLLLEPGTEFQRYRVTFEEPYLFDTPYSFGNDLFYFTRARESWDERRIGDIVTFGRRYGDVWSLSLALRAEQVSITNPQDLFGDRITQTNFPVTANGVTTFFNDTAQEILDQTGSHFLTSIKPGISRDTTDSKIFPTSGTRSSASVEAYGALGGDVDFTKFTLSFDWYYTLYSDLFDRKTVLSLKNQVGISPFGNSPFYERFYLGGIGDLRGFRFRGVSPVAGPLNDPIGGDFMWVTTAEVNFPVYEDFLRAVVFTDIGTVERNITISTIRADVGAGIRINLPIFQGIPLAVDFAYPVSKASGDRTQLVSISLGASF